MVFSYSGIYIKSILQESSSLKKEDVIFVVGLIEGTAESLSYVLKLFSGVLSDWFKKRRLLIVTGLLLNVASRLIYGFFPSFGPVLSARFMERVGNGTYSTPRDAIIADLVSSDRVGKAYGITRSFSQFGAFVGCIIAMIIMQHVCSYERLFQIAAIPALMALVVMVIAVKEPKHHSQKTLNPVPSHRMKFSDIKLLGRSFWLLMVTAAVFMLSRFTEPFLMLYAEGVFNVSKAQIPLVMLVFNGTWCLASYPIGALGDRMNRHWLLCIGIIFLVLADLILATAQTFEVMLLGVACWGVQYGMTLNLFMSLIAQSVPQNLRGTAFGFYFIICATSVMIADTTFGHIASIKGMQFGFVCSGILGALSLLLLVMIMGYKKKPA